MRNDSEEQVDSINDSEELVDAVSDPKSDQSRDLQVATYTINGDFTQTLLISRFVPMTAPAAIRPDEQLVTEDPSRI